MKLRIALTTLLIAALAAPMVASGFGYPRDVTVANSGDHGPNLLIVLDIGWMKGYSDGSFKPARNISPDEMAIALDRAFPDGMTRIQFASFLRGGYERAMLCGGLAGCYLGRPETIPSLATTTIVDVAQVNPSPTTTTTTTTSAVPRHIAPTPTYAPTPTTTTTTTTTVPTLDYRNRFRNLNIKARAVRETYFNATLEYPQGASGEALNLNTLDDLRDAITEIEDAIDYGQSLLDDTRNAGRGLNDVAAVEYEVSTLTGLKNQATTLLEMQTGPIGLSPSGFDPTRFSHPPDWNVLIEATGNSEIENWMTWPWAVHQTIDPDWGTKEQRITLARWAFRLAAQTLESLYAARVGMPADSPNVVDVESAMKLISQAKRALIRDFRDLQVYPFRR